MNQMLKTEPTFLDNEQKDEFERNGFLILESILDESEIQFYKKSILKMRKQITRHQCGKTEGQMRNSEDLLELRNAVSFCHELIDLMIHPKTFPLIVDLMGPHINLVTSHIFYRPPTPNEKINFKQIDWHRDGPAATQISFNGKFPWLYTKVGFFLSDLRIENAGTLKVVPGSHLYDGKAPYSKNSIDPLGAIEIKAPPGSAVIFDNRILHAVGPNYSNVSRENIYFGYGWRYLRPIDYKNQSHDLLNKCSPIQKQLLGDSITDLSYYLPQEIDVPLAKWHENRFKMRSANAE